MILKKPQISDIPIIQNILDQWTDPNEVSKYLLRIEDEINGLIEFNTHFWIIKHQSKTIGVIGYSDPLPKIKQFITTNNSLELKIFYLDGSVRGLGLGKIALNKFETIIKSLDVNQIIIRSALRYRDTAWGFYQKMGYSQIGVVDSDMAVFRKDLNLP